jgi:hypothetical protein
VSIEQPGTEEVGTAAPVDAGGTGPEADRRPLPATSPDELVVRLESLRRPDQKAASATSILDALRIGEGFTFQITDVHRAALVLNELDPRWEARLQVVSRGLRMRGFHRSLADQLIL